MLKKANEGFAERARESVDADTGASTEVLCGFESDGVKVDDADSLRARDGGDGGTEERCVGGVELEAGKEFPTSRRDVDLEADIRSRRFQDLRKKCQR